MKKLIGTIFLLLITFVISKNSLSQNIGRGELMFVNNTGTNGYNITIDIYPVGAIFNGADQYAFVAKYQVPESDGKICGLHQKVLSNLTTEEWFVNGNFDKTSEIRGCRYSFGYGRYRIDIYNGTAKEFTVDVDFSDANYTGTPTTDYYQQLRIDYYSSNDMKFQYYGTGSVPVAVQNNGSINVWEQFGTPNSPKIPSKGDFADYSESATQYHDYPLNAVNYGFFRHETPENISMNLKLINFDVTSVGNIVIQNSTLNINPQRIFNSATSIIINGKNGKLNTDNSKIMFAYAGSLEINEGTLQSNGTTFTSTGADVVWSGIKLDNSFNCYVNNCNFINSRDCLIIENEVSHSTSMNVNISNSLFDQRNIQNIDYQHGIKMYNCVNVQIKNNIFYLFPGAGLSTFGIYDLLAYNLTDAPHPPNPSTINITENNFHNGSHHIGIYYSLDIIHVNIYNNTFYDGDYNIILKQAKGNISSNNFIGQNNLSIWLLDSKTNLLYNNIASLNDNILARGSYPNLAPLQYEGKYVWIGGYNILNSAQSNNIKSDEISMSSYFFTDHGKNYFNTSANNYNLKGYLDDTTNIYYANGNCWQSGNGSSPDILLFRGNNTEIPFIWDNPPDCNWNEGQVSDRILSDNGNGVYDTILVTQSNNPPASADETLYATGVKNELTKSYSTAISNYKMLIDTYPESKNLERAIFDLYDCYVKSDTSGNQILRKNLFTDLKNYIETKIQQYDSNSEFVEVAYDFYLLSEVKIKTYQAAMEGYQYIAENHPAAIKRLMASIAYIEVEGLLQGEGGSQRDNQEYIQLKNESNNKGNLKDILASIYKKTENSIIQKEKFELQNAADKNMIILLQSTKHNEEGKIKDKASGNIKISAGLSKEQRKDRIQESIMALTQKDIKEKIQINNVTKAIPNEYELSQNYPNPFNPVTKINFAIQKQGLVTLKVYDMLGREVAALINEFKQAGYYSLDFNASGLSSGIYFYKLQVNDFTDIKKMVLIK